MLELIVCLRGDAVMQDIKIALIIGGVDENFSDGVRKIFLNGYPKIALALIFGFFRID